jgi:hypothetical protein
MSKQVEILVAPPHKEDMLIAHHVNVDVFIESRNMGKQLANRKSTNRLPTIISIEIPKEHMDRLGADNAVVDAEDYIRVTAEVSHSITGNNISKTNNAALIKQQNIANMLSIYIQNKR